MLVALSTPQADAQKAVSECQGSSSTSTERRFQCGIVSRWRTRCSIVLIEGCSALVGSHQDDLERLALSILTMSGVISSSAGTLVLQTFKSLRSLTEVSCPAGLLTGIAP